MITTHCSELGSFEYDNKLWSIDYDDMEMHWIGGDQRCILPKGVLSCKGMFRNCQLGKDFYFGEFDTSGVTDMSYMFKNATLPEGLQFDLRFNTSRVQDMRFMFANCKLPKGFTLGDRFITSNVERMDGMFMDCQFPYGFSLGNCFDTSGVLNMSRMFQNCRFPIGFTLGGLFTLDSVKEVSHMFESATVPDSFTFDAPFDASYASGINCMFKDFTYGYNEKRTYHPSEIIRLIGTSWISDYKRFMRLLSNVNHTDIVQGKERYYRSW